MAQRPYCRSVWTQSFCLWYINTAMLSVKQEASYEPMTEDVKQGSWNSRRQGKEKMRDNEWDQDGQFGTFCVNQEHGGIIVSGGLTACVLGHPDRPGTGCQGGRFLTAGYPLISLPLLHFSPYESRVEKAKERVGNKEYEKWWWIDFQLTYTDFSIRLFILCLLKAIASIYKENIFNRVIKIKIFENKEVLVTIKVSKDACDYPGVQSQNGNMSYTNCSNMKESCI